MFQQILHTAQDSINTGLENPYLMSVLKVLLILYASQIAPKLPESITKYFSSTWVKIIVLFFITYITSRDLQLAIILAVLFVTSTNLLSGKGAFETFANYSKDYTPYGDMKLIAPRSDIYPGCYNVTLKDLTDLFDGDSIKMQTNVNNKVNSKKDEMRLTRIGDIIGLPDNIEFTDSNAPYIATLLVNQGITVNGLCLPPA
jgi:hypothetical protein